MNLIPTDDTGTRNLSEDIEEGLEPAVEDPNELLGKRFDFRVIIGLAKLPETLCKDTYVEYTVQTGDNKKISTFKTKTVKNFHNTRSLEPTLNQTTLMTTITPMRISPRTFFLISLMEL